MSNNISIRANKEQKRLIKEYANLKGTTISDFMLRATLEKIENEIDLQIALEALAEFEEDSTTYSFDEAMEILGLNE